MVGGFVEQHHVGAHQQDARERHAHLPAAGQRADIALHHLLAEAQAGQDLAGPAIEGVAVELLEACLDLAVALDQGFHLVGPIGVGERRAEIGEFRGDRAHGACAVHHLGDDAAPGHLADILAEIADGDALVAGDLPLVGLLLAGDHPEQGGLAGAVGADQPDLLALLKRGRGLDEHELPPVLFDDSFEAYHASASFV